MIAVVRERLQDGSAVYTGYVQIDVHKGVPILEPALWLGGRSRDEVAHAVKDAQVARRALGDKVARFGPFSNHVVTARSRPPGRVLYFGYCKVDEHEGVYIFEKVSPAQGHIEDAIEMAQEISRAG